MTWQNHNSFMEEASPSGDGKAYKSRRDWDRFKNGKKLIWAFFEAVETSSGALALYSDAGDRAATATKLRNNKLHSLEHIIPKSFLRDMLSSRDVELMRGARTNPFNLWPSHRTINSRRSNRRLDFEVDAIETGVDHLASGFSYTQTGIDDEGEWVIPPRSRGDVARAVLYMVLAYELRRYTTAELKVLAKWAVNDAPMLWEKEYELYVKRFFGGHSNPLISKHGSYTASHLESICLPYATESGQDASPITSPTPTPPPLVGELVVIKVLANPHGPDAGNEAVRMKATTDFGGGRATIVDKAGREHEFHVPQLREGDIFDVVIAAPIPVLSNRQGMLILEVGSASKAYKWDHAKSGEWCTVTESTA